MARTCAEIQADYDRLKARLRAIALGESVEEGGYAGHKVKFTAANPAEIRRQIADLEDEAAACGCQLNGVARSRAIRPVL